jgi:DUF3024 family protein
MPKDQRSALPPLEGQLAEKLLAAFCEARVPAELRDKIRMEYEIRGRNATVWDCRPHWRDATQPWSRMPVAQMRFDPEKHHWLLFWADRNGKWRCNESFPAARKLEDLIEEVEVDPNAFFWG